MPVTEASRDRARTRSGTYVYGIAWADEAAAQETGVGAAAVETVPHRKVAALVSHVDPAGVRARRRDLVAHSDVLIAAARWKPVLPMGFGTVFDSDDALVAELLEPRHDELVALLETFEGLAEVTVRALYDEDDVLREIAASDATVARLRGRGDSLDLGRAVAQALAARRTRDRDAILRRIRPLVHDVHVDDPQSELEVLRAAFLVDRDALPELDAVVGEIAAEGNAMSFKYVGPLPPFHFVQLPLSEAR
jgi:hypothetical protein